MDYDLFTFHPLTAVIGFAAVGLLWLLRKPKKNLPPGPPSWPIVGTMLSFNLVDLFDAAKVRKLSDKYGDIITLTVLGNHTIVLNSYDVIREAFINNPLDFANRGISHLFMQRQLSPDCGGILVRDFDDGGRQLRSTSLTILRDLGAGRAVMEDVIAHEAKVLGDVFESHKTEAFEPTYPVTAAIANVILQITVSQRYEHTDVRLQKLIHDTDTFMANARVTVLLDAIPTARLLPKLRQLYKDLLESNSGMIDFMWVHAQRLMSSYSDGANSNFVESFLTNALRNKTDKKRLDKRESHDLKYLLRDFIVAGSETTTSSLSWTLITLANNPAVQEKLHSAINDVIGDSRTYRLRDNIPYLDAFVWEIQRFHTIAPTGVPHAVSTEGEGRLRGYTIPKDATILFNLNGVHNNKTTWGDPEVFRPERFLNDDGEFVKHPHVIPFGIGKRSCLGELLARQELYIFTAMISQRFKILPEEGTDKIDSARKLSFANVPMPFKIRAVPRN